MFENGFVLFRRNCASDFFHPSVYSGGKRGQFNPQIICAFCCFSLDEKSMEQGVLDNWEDDASHESFVSYSCLYLCVFIF